MESLLGWRVRTLTSVTGFCWHVGDGYGLSGKLFFIYVGRLLEGGSKADDRVAPGVSEYRKVPMWDVRSETANG
jgi:hypothetical protein